MGKNKWRKSIIVQMTFAIALFIAVIEFILLIFSYQAKEQEYQQLNRYIVEKVKQADGVDISDPFDKKFVDRKLRKFALNISLLTLLIIIFVTVGMVYIVNRFGVKHLKKIVQLNQSSTLFDLQKCPESEIPNNEIGDIMRYRNELLDRIDLAVAKQASLADMASTIAHEINTPLAIISSSATILKHESASEEPDLEVIRKKVERIDKTIWKMKKIVKGIYVLAKDDREHEEMEEYWVNEVVEDAVEFSKQTAHLNSVEIKPLKIDDGLRLSGRSYQIFQILLNLIKNACEAVRETQGAWVEIKILEETHLVSFLVIDSGPGLPENIKEKIFDQSFSSKGNGNLGVGLGLCKKLVEENLGTIEVSEYNGHTCFKFSFQKLKLAA